MQAFLYTRTNIDDGRDSLIPSLQRDACEELASRAGLEIVREFADNGVLGTIPMHVRPQGKLLIAALLTDSVKTVLTYDARRIGQTQRVFLPFIGLCRDNDIEVTDFNGNDLRQSAMAGVDGMLAKLAKESTVARMADGKRQWKGIRRTDGRWPYGEHPRLEFAGERAIVQRIQAMRAEGMSPYRIGRVLTAEGIRTRYGKEFKSTQIGVILARSQPTAG